MVNSIRFMINNHGWHHLVDCGKPSAPQRGYLERYNDTTVGSEVFYSCDQGLVPEGRMRAVCTRNGWSPTPADLSCTGSLSENPANCYYLEFTNYL